MTEFQEITIPLSDGYSAYARYWKGAPPKPPLMGGTGGGAVLYHHGIQSHCGWFESSARMLAEAGYAVLQVDRRGCGRNQQARGHAESADQLVDDSRVARDELARRCGHVEHHVVGVSWGGKLAVAAYVSDPAEVRSLSLVTPGLFPQVGVSKDEAARIGFAMLYEPETQIDIPLNRAELLTETTAWRKYFGRDLLTLRQCTASFYLASRRMDKVVARLEKSAPVPIHLILAGVEGIIDNEKTEQFVGGLNWPRTRVTRFAEARHCLEFESIRDNYFERLVEFITTVDAKTESHVDT